MSENRNEAGEVNANAPGSGELESAMKDALRSVEGREAAASEEGKKSPDSALMESMLKAKKELEEALAQTQTEAKSLKDKWLRAAADLDNYKKRAVRERDEMGKFGNEQLLRSLVPIVDDFERVVSSAQKTEVEAAKALADGVRLVLKKFLDQLEKHGVTTFETVGLAFDPNQHEAVQQTYSERPAGTVDSQLQRGFLLHGRLIRPALVTVSMGPAPQKE